MWAASLVLCDVVAAAAQQQGDASAAGSSLLPAIRGARVLELGAGCGLPSLTAHLCGAAATLLTEQPTVASLLQRTVSEHFPTAAAAAGGRSPDPTTAPGEGEAGQQGRPVGRIAAAALDWAAVARPTPEPAAAEAEPAVYRGRGWPPLCGPTPTAGGAEGWEWEVILCSDCVYEPLYGDSWRLLSAALQALTTAKTVALVACERRRADGVEDFLAALRSWGAVVECERRLRLPPRWWERQGQGGGEGEEGVAELRGSSAGLVEVYAVRKGDGCGLAGR